MELIQMVVTALVLGIAAGTQTVTEEAIKDAYQGLRSFIRSKYEDVNLRGLERRPESRVKQDSVAEDLLDAGAESDAELVNRAQHLMRLVAEKQPSVATTVGIDLEDSEIKRFIARRITAHGTGSTGMRVRGSTMDEMEIGEVEAVSGATTRQGNSDPKASGTEGEAT